ncbi:AbiJ-NTD4 domain-containing protein [Dolosigranulum savutiense]|uniref:HEPN AbiJ-N-terminal domain-containing protein n=1 Tax=Dolosigranulum savutiense TaxID=3110288 RepID=A0AB74TSD5_9LACT
MKLYSERYDKRAPLEKTYSINKDMYLLLLNCCTKYQKNLTHKFKQNCYDDFTERYYDAFDEKAFTTRIKIRIPSLFRDEYDRICPPTYDDEYDQYALLDLIEFFAQNIKDISEKWNNEKYKNYEMIVCYNSSKIFKDFKEEINEIFTESGLLYELIDEKIIERIVIYSPLTMEIEENIEKVNEVGTRELLEDAIKLHKTSNPAARQESVEKLWDALERLKTYYTKLDKKCSAEKIVDNMANGNSDFADLFNKEFKMLTDIGNKYRIRHHETNIIDIPNNSYYDYLFNRCLSLIALAIQYLK